MPPSGGRNTPTNRPSLNIYPHVNKTWEFLFFSTWPPGVTHLAKKRGFLCLPWIVVMTRNFLKKEKQNGRSWFFFLMAPSVVDRKETKGNRHGKGKMHHVACKYIFILLTIQYPPERYGEISVFFSFNVSRWPWEKSLGKVSTANIFFCIDTYDGSKKFQNEPLK